MKKFLTLVAVLFTLTSTFAQSTAIEIKKVQVYSYNELTDDWDLYRTYKPTSMHFELDNDVVLIDDANDSKYVITKMLNSEDEKCMNFAATDRNDDLCGVQFCFNESMSAGIVRVMYVKKLLTVYTISE